MRWPIGASTIQRSTFLGHAAGDLALVFCALVPVSAAATEGGTSHYLPGAVATLIDLAPTQPGWVVELVYLHYEGDAGTKNTLPVAGLEALGLKATLDALLVGGFYTLDRKVLGAYYSVGAMLPCTWITAEAKIETVIGNLRVRDTEEGLGDVTLIPVMLGWKEGSWQYDLALSVYAPTGEYGVGRLANPGLNYWSVNPIVGAAYSNPKTGFNAALHGGVLFNTQNPDTDYRSGTLVHLEGSVQQLVPAGKGFLSLGLEGFWVEQVTADSGQRPILGDFKGRTAGLGPVLGYVLPLGKQNFVTELRWLRELDTRNRLEGDYVWLKLVYQF